jgi:general secretion pathway protein G
MVRTRGFTLIELLVALAIVALLLSIVVPRYFGSISRTEEAVLKENLRSLRDAIDKHYADTGRYPDTLRHPQRRQRYRPRRQTLCEVVATLASAA